MEAIQAIQNRASYRGVYAPTPVPRADLETILHAGLAAPSGCNKQTTSLIAVDDPAVMQKLYALVTPYVGVTAPALILVLSQPICAYRDMCFSKQDYSAAIENMLLAITALGYESCWVEGYITDKDRIGRKMANVLGVPETYDLVCYLPVGRAAEPVKRVAKKSFHERAWFNGFQNSIKEE